MRESLLQSKLHKALDTHGIYYVKIVVASKAGGSDTIACIDGKFFAIEFKGTGGRMSELQKYKRDKILKGHGNYFLVTPENYDEMLGKILEYKA